MRKREIQKVRTHRYTEQSRSGMGVMTVRGCSVYLAPPAGHGARGAVGAGFRVSGFMHRSERLWGRLERDIGAGLDMSGVQPPTVERCLGGAGDTPPPNTLRSKV